MLKKIPSTPFRMVVILLAIVFELIFGITQSALSQSNSFMTALEVSEAKTASSVFVPMLVGPPPDVRPLGTVYVYPGSSQCSGGVCYQIEVECPQISRAEEATLRVGGSSGSAGTILFATGWTGSYFWGGESTVSSLLMRDGFFFDGVDLNAVLNNNQDILHNLQEAGFKTVEIKWQRNWFQAELGEPEGMGRLACKPATVAQWVYDNLHDQGDSAPYCATGHSNGASQMAYAISQYGLTDILSSVVMEGGPNWTYIDHACIHDDPNYSHLYAESGERNTIDWGFGYPNNGAGPCATQDVSWRSQFKEGSIGYGNWDYSYPKTMVAFVVGGDDNTKTAAQGDEFYDLLVQKGSPLISWELIPGAGHGVTEIPEGAQAMEDTLLNTCQLH